MGKTQKIRAVGKTREAATETLAVFFTNAVEVMLSFAIWPATVILAVLFRNMWFGSYYVLGFLCLVPLVITPFVMILDPGPSKALGAHVGIVTGLISALLFMIDLSGFSQMAMFGLIAVVPLLCLTLSIRAAMNKKGDSGLEDIFHKAGVKNKKTKQVGRMVIHPNKD